MTTTNKTAIMTHSQFIAARALANLYGHLWASVPDGTYNLDDIEAYAMSIDSQFAGITSPSYEFIDPSETLVITHTTGTGRLRWEVQPSGNVRLTIYRPNKETQAYETLHSSIEQIKEVPSGTPVLVVELINDDCDIFDINDGGAEVIITAMCCDNREIPGNGIDTPRVEYKHDDSRVYSRYGSDMFSYEIAERHIDAAIRCVIELMTLDIKRPEEWLPKEEYQVWKQENLQERIDRIKVWFQPLLDAALPDPLTTEYVRDHGTESNLEWLKMNGEELLPLPETFWHRPFHHDYNKTCYIVHNREEFPVESEKTATAAVQILRKNPEMPFLEAIKEAVCSC